MNDLQKTWSAYLDGTRKSNKARREYNSAKIEQVKAWDKLLKHYKGWEQDDLVKEWDKNYAEITRAFYQDTSRYPDAHEIIINHNKKWQNRVNSKRTYFLNRLGMQDTSQRLVQKPHKRVQTETLIDRLKILLAEIEGRVPGMEKCVMKEFHAACERTRKAMIAELEERKSRPLHGLRTAEDWAKAS